MIKLLRFQRSPAPVLLAIAALLVVPLSEGAERTVPLSPADALASFQLEPGLKIELVAAEPLVIDPVAFTFDADRRLYVVEGRGYPDHADRPPGPLVGRVARLEDTDGDGSYDRRTEFATGLNHPNGILLWRGGVIVTCAPDVLYLKDDNGDGIADTRRVLLTGFVAANTSQLMVTYPTLGLDGLVYVTTGRSGGKVTAPEHPDRPPVAFTQADGRFDPNTLVYETTAGRGQYGLSLDPFGRRFICVNRQPVMHVVLEQDNLRRNPALSLTSTVEEVSKSQSAAKVFPISRARVGADFMPQLMSAPHSGSFTSACGLLIFSGTALGPAHVGNAFICEPAQNLIQRQVMQPHGSTFRSEPPYTGKEFLATTDTWFRPVYLGHGPDGALYIADMYRRELDHPKFLPAEVRGQFDFESGKDSGRIYRITKATRRDSPMRMATVEDRCRLLDSAEEWQRALGFQRLMEAAEPAVIPVLQKSLFAMKTAAGRVRAFSVLRARQALSPDLIQKGLQDVDAGVREHAVRLAEPLLASNPALVAAVAKMSADEGPRVRFACALTLGAVADERALQPLAAIAARDGADSWTRAAILTGLSNRLPQFMDILLKVPHASPGALAAVMADVGNTLGAGGDPAAGGAFLERMLVEGDGWSWRLSAVRGLAEGWRPAVAPKRGQSVRPASLRDVIAKTREDLAPALERFFKKCARVAADRTAPKQERTDAVAVLGYSDFARAAPMLAALLDPRDLPELQLAAIRALERLGDPRGAKLLVRKESWSGFTPQIREAAIASLTSKPELLLVLFDAVQAGVVAPTQIAPNKRGQFAKHSNPTVRARTAEIFKDFETGDRMQIYRARRSLLERTGDAAKGRQAFIQACSACHAHEGEGGKVGPDLTGIRNQPADALLLHILVPNYEIAPGYQTFTVTTQEGATFSGWLAGESDTHLTLRTAAGTEETVTRAHVASLNASGTSLMPDGLEQVLNDDQLRDLIAFLRTGAIEKSK